MKGSSDDRHVAWGLGPAAETNERLGKESPLLETFLNDMEYELQPELNRLVSESIIYVICII